MVNQYSIDDTKWTVISPSTVGGKAEMKRKPAEAIMFTLVPAMAVGCWEVRKLEPLREME